MKRPAGKIAHTICFVEPILAELDRRLQSEVSRLSENSQARTNAHLRLIDAQRAHRAHTAKCTICRRVQPFQSAPSRIPRRSKQRSQRLSESEFNQLCDDINDLFEYELMRLARMECAALHDEEVA